MSVDTVTTFFALLAIVALVVVVVTGLTALVAKLTGGLPGWAVETRDAVSPLALPLAFAVALTCMLGSLYLSKVAKFPPCIFCWYQRIAMYPLVVLLAVASLRRDRAVKWYVVPLALIGMGISIYHYLVERFPETVSSSCSAGVPCSTVWVWKFHFLSIPAMAGLGFALIITLVLLAGSSGSDSGPAGRGTTLDEAERATIPPRNDRQEVTR